jgi:hypothetical protein
VDTNNSSEHQPIEAPSGLDLHPQPQKAVRISRRASMAIVSVIVLLLLAFAYGGYRRTLTNQTAARDAGLPRNVTPATQAGTEFMQATPAGTVPMTLRPPDELIFARTSHQDDTARAALIRRPASLSVQSTNRSALRRPSPGASRRAATERDATQPVAPRRSTRRRPKSAGLPPRISESRKQSRRPPASAIPPRHRSPNHGQPASNRSFSGRSPEPCSGRAAGR